MGDLFGTGTSLDVEMCPNSSIQWGLLYKSSVTDRGNLFSDDTESPTVVLDRIDGTSSPLQTLHHLGAIVPPITVADGVVTPDPFRDVIRTEPAPDLPSLIEDMMPYLLERHTSVGTTPITKTTSKFTTSTQERSTESAPLSFPQISTGSVSVASITPNSLGEISNSNNSEEHLEEETSHGTDFDGELNIEEEKNEYSGISFDSVLQFLFSDDGTTKAPTRTTRRPVTRRPTSDRSTPQKTVTTSHTTATPSSLSENLNEAGNNKQSDNTTDILNTALHNEDSLNYKTSSTAPINKYGITPQAVLTTGLNSIKPSTSTREPSPGSPPKPQHLNLPVLVSADPGAVSGILKLAGCNIYGRMYRVGRIISELSGPCLECMCTEVGVQCRPLDC